MYYVVKSQTNNFLQMCYTMSRTLSVQWNYKVYKKQLGSNNIENHTLLNTHFVHYLCLKIFLLLTNILSYKNI